MANHCLDSFLLLSGGARISAVGGAVHGKYIFKQYSPVQTNMAEAKKSGGGPWPPWPPPPKTATALATAA